MKSALQPISLSPGSALCALALLFVTLVSAQEIFAQNNNQLKQAIIKDFSSKTYDEQGRVSFSIAGSKAVKSKDREEMVIDDLKLAIYRYSESIASASELSSSGLIIQLEAKGASWYEDRGKVLLSGGFVVKANALQSANQKERDLDARFEGTSGEIHYANDADSSRMEIKDAKSVRFQGFDLEVNTKTLNASLVLGNLGGESKKVELKHVKIDCDGGTRALLPQTFSLPYESSLSPLEKQRDARFEISCLGAAALDFRFPQPGNTGEERSGKADLTLRGGCLLFTKSRLQPVLSSQQVTLSGALGRDDLESGSGSGSRESRLMIGQFRFSPNKVRASGEVATTVAGVESAAEELTILLPPQPGMENLQYHYAFENNIDLRLIPEPKPEGEAGAVESLTLRAKKKVTFTQRTSYWSLQADEQVRASFELRSSDTGPSRVHMNGSFLALEIDVSEEALKDSSRATFGAFSFEDLLFFECRGSGVLPRLSFSTNKERKLALFADEIYAIRLDQTKELSVTAKGEKCRVSLHTLRTIIASTTESWLEADSPKGKLSREDGVNAASATINVESQQPIHVKLQNLPAYFGGSTDAPTLVTLRSEGDTLLEEFPRRPLLRSAVRAGAISARFEFQVNDDEWSLISGTVQCEAPESGVVATAIGKNLIYASRQQFDYLPEHQQCVVEAPTKVIVRDPRVIDLIEKQLLQPLAASSTAIATSVGNTLRLESSGSLVVQQGVEKRDSTFTFRLPSEFSIRGFSIPLNASTSGAPAIDEWQRHRDVPREEEVLLQGESLSIRNQRSTTTRTTRAFIGGAVRFWLKKPRLELQSNSVTLAQEKTSTEISFSPPFRVYASYDLTRAFLISQGNAATADDYPGGYGVESPSICRFVAKPIAPNVKNVDAAEKDPGIQVTMNCDGKFIAYGFTGKAPKKLSNFASARHDRISGEELSVRVNSLDNAGQAFPGLEEFEIKNKVFARVGTRALSGKKLVFDPHQRQFMLDNEGLDYDIDENTKIEGVKSVEISGSTAGAPKDPKAKSSSATRVRIKGKYIKVRTGETDSKSDREGGVESSSQSTKE